MIYVIYKLETQHKTFAVRRPVREIPGIRTIIYFSQSKMGFRGLLGDKRECLGLHEKSQMTYAGSSLIVDPLQVFASTDGRSMRDLP